METVKNYIKTRTVGYWLMAGAFVCDIVAMILYLVNGANQYTGGTLMGSLTAGFIVFAVLSVAMLVYELRIAKYLTAAVGLYTFGMYIVYEVDYITNVFTGIDDIIPSILVVFIFTVVFAAAAFGLSTASAVKMGSGLAREKKEKKEKNADNREEADA